MEFNNHVNELTTAEYIGIQIDDFEKSPQYKWMQDGKMYYRGENTKIAGRTMLRYENERQVVDLAKPNNRLKHAFLNLLVDDKINYLLSKPLTMDCENDGYLQSVKEILGRNFQRYLIKLGTDAAAKGMSWMHPYIDENGEFRIKMVNGEQVVPAWADDEHEDLANVVWFYPVEMWEGKAKTVVIKAEYWTADGVSYWVRDGRFSGGFILDAERYFDDDIQIDDKGELQQHFKVGSGAGAWGRVPFIAFKNNDYEMSDLQPIKSLIDDYDKTTSDLSNSIEDIKSTIFALRGYGGENFSEFLRDLSYYKVINLDDDGGLETYNPTINVETFKEHYDALRKDIYTFGQGVDKDNDRFGSAPSGTALKFMYSGLDLKCNKLESTFRQGFNKLMYFVNEYMKLTSQAVPAEPNINLIFNRDIAINESQTIADCQASVGLLSKETILARHPWVKDVPQELERLEAEAMENSVYELPDDTKIE